MKYLDTIHKTDLKQRQPDRLKFYILPKINSPASLIKTIFIRILVLLIITGLSYNFYTIFIPATSAAFNGQINYQGKLTDASNVAVPDGTYNFRFELCTASDCAGVGDPIWTEIWCFTSDGVNCDGGPGDDRRVFLTSGLFSVLLDTYNNSLSSIDFNQTLYLQVEAGGSGATPSWQTLTPRKKLGAIPAAFEAGKLDGIDSASFLRSDTSDNYTSGTLTFDAGTIVNLSAGTLAGASPIVFEGATADEFETTFTITDPTADRVITFPNASITVNAAADISGTTLAASVVTSSLTTVGTIGSGTWQGALIAGQYGGTGVANTGDTITLGGNIDTANAFSTSGNFALTLTTTNTTNVTLPTTGTLVTLAGAETFTNKVSYNGLVVTPDTGVITTGTW